MEQREYYLNNSNYSKFLDNQSSEFFTKYTDKVNQLLKGRAFLDVGCGTGIALTKITSKEKHGVEISKPSIDACRSKGLNCDLYDGKKLPFENERFGVTGCIDVLEHVENPVSFLDELNRVTEKNGFLIIACPNFLSITNSYHCHTKGPLQKIRNVADSIKRLFSTQPHFQKMKTINRPDFHPDDDACNITNPIDIIHWAHSRNLTVTYWSGRTNYLSNQVVNKVIDRLPFKLFLGSSFIIIKK